MSLTILDKLRTNRWLLCFITMEIVAASVFKTWDRFYRGNFINSLSGFKSASLIATVNPSGIPNLAIFSNIVHIGADPALIGFINRPRESAPHTLGNIEANHSYTINNIHPSFVERAHQTSAKYDKDINEFEAVGLTEEWLEGSIVPFVKESRICYQMELVEIIPIRHNNTFFVIGEIQRVRFEKEILQPDGFLALEKVDSLTSLGIDAYYKVEPIGRYAYAKVGRPVGKI